MTEILIRKYTYLYKCHKARNPKIAHRYLLRIEILKGNK